MHSGKVGKLILWNHPMAKSLRNQYPFVGGRTPESMKWVAVVLDSGEVIAMPKNRVFPI